MPDIMQEKITVFDKLPAAKPRYLGLSKAFEEKYGRKPAYIARAPGRVHIWDHRHLANLANALLNLLLSLSLT
jgi:hypothetical protein